MEFNEGKVIPVDINNEIDLKLAKVLMNKPEYEHCQ